MGKFPSFHQTEKLRIKKENNSDESNWWKYITT